MVKKSSRKTTKASRNNILHEVLDETSNSEPTQSTIDNRNEIFNDKEEHGDNLFEDHDDNNNVKETDGNEKNDNSTMHGTNGKNMM